MYGACPPIEAPPNQAAIQAQPECAFQLDEYLQKVTNNTKGEETMPKYTVLATTAW